MRGKESPLKRGAYRSLGRPFAAGFTCKTVHPPRVPGGLSPSVALIRRKLPASGFGPANFRWKR